MDIMIGERLVRARATYPDEWLFECAQGGMTLVVKGMEQPAQHYAFSAPWGSWDDVAVLALAVKQVQDGLHRGKP